MAQGKGWTNLDAAFAELEAECTDIIRGLTVRVWNGILVKTPQYYGRMAASWTYCLNNEVFYDRSDEVDPQSNQLDANNFRSPFDFQPLRKGHPDAIAVANAANKGRDRAFRLGNTVYLTNGVDHGEGPYSQAVEDGEVVLRSVNLPGAPASRTLDWAGTYYKSVSRAKAQSLKTLSIG